MAQDSEVGAWLNPAGAILEAFDPKIYPRWPQIAQDSPKLAEKEIQDAPKLSKDCLK
jgi:hypothetical protein